MERFCQKQGNSPEGHHESLWFEKFVKFIHVYYLLLQNVTRFRQLALRSPAFLEICVINWFRTIELDCIAQACG